jgi:outer membrane protein assembly factor BamD
MIQRCGESIRRRGLARSRRAAHWGGAALVLGFALALSGCRSLGREVNQALPEFMRSDPGSEELETFAKRRRIANRTPEELARAQRDFEEAKAYYAQGDWKQSISALDIFLESYPDTPFDKEARVLHIKANLAAEEHNDAKLALLAYIKLYPVSEFSDEIEKLGFDMALSYLRGEQDFFIFSESSEGVKILKEIATNFPGGVYADDSRWELAQFYFLEESAWIEAEEQYRALVESYPDSPWAARAQYHVALCNLNRVKGPAYDQELMAATIKEFRLYTERFADGDRVAEARAHMAELTAMLAEKHLLIAEWYIGQDLPRAARFYLLRLIKLFPGLPQAAEAQRLLETLPPEDATAPEPMFPRSPTTAPASVETQPASQPESP